jgi:hypothetical protein
MHPFSRATNISAAFSLRPCTIPVSTVFIFLHKLGAEALEPVPGVQVLVEGNLVQRRPLFFGFQSIAIYPLLQTLTSTLYTTRGEYTGVIL